jgi:mono/diheme cytochrome c family protein
MPRASLSLRPGPALFLFLTPILTLSLTFAGWLAQAADVPDAAEAEGELDGWRAPEEVREAPNPVEATEESITLGKALYVETCSRCHGPEAKGDGKMAKILPVKPADLAARLPAQADGELFWKISEGKRPMPGFKQDLGVDARWNLVNYLRSLTASVADSASAGEAAAEEAR